MKSEGGRDICSLQAFFFSRPLPLQVFFFSGTSSLYDFSLFLGAKNNLFKNTTIVSRNSNLLENKEVFSKTKQSFRERNKTFQNIEIFFRT